MVLVIGAGAAGLTAAIRAAESGARVMLMNAHPKVGLKILMSGGTRCNVTHREVTERDFHGGSRPFVARILRAFPAEAARTWLESLGVALKLEETGKVFPVSDDAQTVLDALLGAAERAGVEVVAGARVVRLERGASIRLGIQRVADSTAFAEVRGHGERSWPLPALEPDEWIEADVVILAAGGLSFPRTGSDGTGHALLAALGHTIEPPVPALTPLTSDDPLCSALQGVTCDVELTLRTGAARPTRVRGSMLFTHFGYSGPAALDLSRHWLRAEGSERRVTASFLPGSTPESLAADVVRAAAESPRRSVRRWCAERLPERLAHALCDEARLAEDLPLGQLSREGRAALVHATLARPMPVTGTLGYEKAEVTAGGVRLSEVNPSTLESRIVPGLYLCGEVLDVDGRLGGFNFQWAWSSGTVAGRSAARSPSAAR
jgi:predicted Rossmann fold flavoprotein